MKINKEKTKQNENDTIAAYNINLMTSEIYECKIATKSTVNNISNRQMFKLELDSNDSEEKHCHGTGTSTSALFVEVRFLYILFLCFRRSHQLGYKAKNQFTVLCNFCENCAIVYQL